MNFLLDCSVEDENDEICMFNFTNGYLPDRISSDITWTKIKQSRVNAELVSLARALNGDGPEGRSLYCSTSTAGRLRDGSSGQI